MNRCPWCRETLSVIAKAPLCPHCGRTVTNDAGERIRDIDLEYDRIAAEADSGSLTWVKRGMVIALVLAVLAVVPVVAPVAYFLLVIAQFVIARFFVARPYTRQFGAVRRLVTRWTSRMVLFMIVMPAHAAAFVPGLAILVSPLVFGLTLWGLRAYMRFHLKRERERIGVLFVEKVFLVLLVLFVLTSGCVFGLVIYGAVTWFS